MEQLIAEIRLEFHIPPYFKNEGIQKFILEGKARLDFLNPGRDYEKDLIYRHLLKNYVYYAYHHITHEWERNYADMIRSWMLGCEVLA